VPLHQVDWWSRILPQSWRSYLDRPRDELLGSTNPEAKVHGPAGCPSPLFIRKTNLPRPWALPTQQDCREIDSYVGATLARHSCLNIRLFNMLEGYD
jgi:hypothetical protein